MRVQHQNGSLLADPLPNGKHAADMPPPISPMKPPLRRKNSKALYTGSSMDSSPPDSPGGSQGAAQEGGAQEPPAQELHPTRSSPFFAISSLLRTRSDNLLRRQSHSFDLREAPSLASTGLATAESMPHVELQAPRPPARHQRSKSTSLVLGGQMQQAQEDTGQAPPASALKRLISVATCVANPRVEEGPKLPPPPPPPLARPNAALCNPGNMCFFVAMLQCLSYTQGLPERLWRGFPDVPPPPPPPEHEPLAEFAPPAAVRAAAAAAAANGKAGKLEAERAEKKGGEAADKPEGERAGPSPRVSLGSSSASGSFTPRADMQPADGALLPTASDKSTAGSEAAETAAQLQENGSARSEAAASVSEAGSTAGGKPEEEAQANGTVSASPASSRQSNDGSAERDQKVWEMSRRARAAAGEEAEAARVRQLSQALAFVMAQMRKDSAAPLNPFPAMYAAARLPKLAELIDGNQQDIHEFWMSLTELFSEREHSFEEAGASLSDLFLGKLRTLTECKKCHDAKARPAETFFDLSLPPVAKNSGTLSVASSLSAYFTEGINPDVECSLCKGADAAQKQAAVPKTYLGKIQGVFAKPPEGKLWEKPRIQSAPRRLVLHFKRHDVVPPSHSQEQHRVRKVDAAVKVDLALQLDKFMVSSAELPEEEGQVERSSACGEALTQAEPSCNYRLYGCIFHKGQTQNRGHYYAMCRVGPSDDDWYIFDDHNKPGSLSGRPGHETSKYLNLHEIERREVCMLFYEQAALSQKARK